MVSHLITVPILGKGACDALQRVTMITTSLPINSSGFGSQANGAAASNLGQTTPKPKEVDKVELPLGAYEFSQQLFRRQPVDEVVILEPTTVESGPLATRKSQEQNLLQATGSGNALPFASYPESQPPVAGSPSDFPETASIDLESSPNSSQAPTQNTTTAKNAPFKDITPRTNTATSDDLQLSTEAKLQEVETKRTQASLETEKNEQYRQTDKANEVKQQALRTADQVQPAESSSSGPQAFNRLI